MLIVAQVICFSFGKPQKWRPTQVSYKNNETGGLTVRNLSFIRSKPLIKEQPYTL